MKTARTIHRTAKFAIQNFWRNIWLSIATILVFLLTLTMVNVLITLNVLTQTAVDSVEDRIDVSIYFKQGTPEKTILEAQDYLLGLSQVAGVDYVSSENAYTRFSDRHRNDSSILDALETVETNPFGGSLIIRAEDPEDFDFILEALNNPTFGEEIQRQDFDDHERIIERINGLTYRIRALAMVVGGIFVIIAILIVFNSIRVAIYTHREEIGIMKLVGASNSFIRMPFILEAVFFSFIATAVMAGVLVPLSQVVEPQLNAFFDGKQVGLLAYYMTNWWIIFGAQFGALVLLSVLSAMVAMSRYLKV
jgi:cell division transport system permease protein